MKEEKKLYDEFVRSCQNASFTDPQINVLWEFINRIAQVKALGGGMF